jgi:hypothetical protein
MCLILGWRRIGGISKRANGKTNPTSSARHMLSVGFFFFLSFLAAELANGQTKICKMSVKLYLT